MAYRWTRETRIAFGSPTYLYQRAGAIECIRSDQLRDVPASEALWRVVIIRADGKRMYARWWAGKPVKSEVERAVMAGLRRDDSNAGRTVVPASVEKRCIGLTKMLDKDCRQRTRQALHNADAGTDAVQYADRFLFNVAWHLKASDPDPARVYELGLVGDSCGLLDIQTDGVYGTHWGEHDLIERIRRQRAHLRSVNGDGCMGDLRRLLQDVPEAGAVSATAAPQ